MILSDHLSTSQPAAHAPAKRELSCFSKEVSVKKTWPLGETPSWEMSFFPEPNGPTQRPKNPSGANGAGPSMRPMMSIFPARSFKSQGMHKVNALHCVHGFSRSSSKISSSPFILASLIQPLCFSIFGLFLQLSAGWPRPG